MPSGASEGTSETGEAGPGEWDTGVTPMPGPKAPERGRTVYVSKAKMLQELGGVHPPVWRQYAERVQGRSRIPVQEALALVRFAGFIPSLRVIRQEPVYLAVTMHVALYDQHYSKARYSAHAFVCTPGQPVQAAGFVKRLTLFSHHRIAIQKRYEWRTLEELEL